MTRIALLIGVDTYTNDPTPLRGPQNDVASWRAQLTAVGFADIRVLDSPDTATADAAVSAFVTDLAAGGAESQGFFFFAGHGALRARAWSSLFLADYAGQLGPPPAGAYASDGALHLESLRDAVETRAPDATLFAVVDACRVLDLDETLLTGPVRGIDAEWSENHLVLVTAAVIGQQSYERSFQGVWQGQLTWALTTLLEQWQAGEDPDGAPYVQVSMTDLVDRAARMIAAISAGNEPQTPGLYASPEGKATAVFHFVGAHRGTTMSSPQDAPGHEWGGDVCGVITQNGGTYGYFRTDTASNVYYQFQGPLPGGAQPLTFSVIPVSAWSPSNVQQTWTAPAVGPTALGNPPATMLVAANGTIGLAILNSKLQWYLPPNGQGQYVLPNSVALSSGSLVTSGSTRQLVDVVTQQVGPWGVGGAGNIYVNGSVIGTFSTAADGTVTLQILPNTLPSGLSMKCKIETPSNITGTIYTAPPVGWTWVPTAPSTVMPVSADASVGIYVQNGAPGTSGTWVIYANMSGPTVKLPNVILTTGNPGQVVIVPGKQLFSYTLNLSPSAGP